MERKMSSYMHQPRSKIGCNELCLTFAPNRYLCYLPARVDAGYCGAGR